MKKVMCFGTFDLFHLGHLNYFKQAKKLGDYLIVVIARDINVQKKAVFNEKERLELIKNLKIVDEALLGDKKDFLKIIEQKKQAVICLGYDHHITEKDLRAKLKQRKVAARIKRMKSYQIQKHKSSFIRNSLYRNFS